MMLLAASILAAGCEKGDPKQDTDRMEQVESIADGKAALEIIRRLERATTDVMGVAEEKSGGREAPSFEELEPELAKYNTAKAIQRWEDMYENDPGWILEPRGLVYVMMGGVYEPSLELLEASEKQAIITFKSYGNLLYQRAERVEYTLARSGGTDWKIDEVKADPLLDGFTKQEAEEIAAQAVAGVKYAGEDEAFYYFHDAEPEPAPQHHRFHKRDGYLETDLPGNFPD